MAACKICAICDIVGNVLNLSGYVPAVLYVTDFRLVFILTAIYTSLVAQFRQAANQEAEADINSERTFRINSDWTNHSIYGGVSDRILWTCRDDSNTASYYKTLYLGLIIIYFVIVTVYFIVRVIMTSLIAHVAWKLEFGEKGKRNRRLRYLEVVGNGLKCLDQYRSSVKVKYEDAINETLEYSKKAEGNAEAPHKDFSKMLDDLTAKVKESKNKSEKKWNRLTQESNFLYNWLVVLYVIPRFETLLMLVVLSLTLTSYDIHPLGCLSPIDVSYSEVDLSVTLAISNSVVRFQRASVILSVVLAVFWLLVKVFHFCLLPRVGWGLVISKSPNCCWSISWHRTPKAQRNQQA